MASSHDTSFHTLLSKGGVSDTPTPTILQLFFGISEVSLFRLASESCAYDKLYIVPLHLHCVCSLTLSCAINVVIIIAIDIANKRERKYDWFIMSKTMYHVYIASFSLYNRGQHTIHSKRDDLYVDAIF